MKMIKMAAAAALVATSFSPALMAPAFASVTASPGSLQSGTETSMNAVCAAHLATLGGGTLHDGSAVYSVALAVGDSTAGAATEAGPRTLLPGSQFGAGSSTLSGPYSIQGQPYRTGGSVNMFGDQYAGQKNWSASEYDFTADYAYVTTFSYSCNVTEHTEITVPGELIPGAVIPGHPVEGYYWNSSEHPNGPGGDHKPQLGCNGLNPSVPWWGEDSPNGQCVFVKTGDAVADSNEPDVQLPDTYTPGPDVDHPELSLLNQSIDQNDSANFQDHEFNGPAIFELGSFFSSQVVVCISPKKLPGIWTTQNGYTGTSCNTAYFNIAPWGSGSQTSKGTYISVPAI